MEKELVLWEMHAHTSPASRCAHLSGREVVRGVKAGGCFGVVITDHYDPERFHGAQSGKAFKEQVRDLFDGYRAAAKAGQEEGLVVLPASELRITAGNEDYLLYGFHEEIALEAGCLTELSLKAVRERLAPFGVLIVQAHPFRPNQHAADPKLLDGVEVFNGNPRQVNSNELALDFAQKHGLLMTRGSDIHQSVDFSSAHMSLPPVLSEGELVKALREYARTPDA